jgi:hypothetical protein
VEIATTVAQSYETGAWAGHDARDHQHGSRRGRGDREHHRLRRGLHPRSERDRENRRGLVEGDSVLVVLSCALSSSTNGGFPFDCLVEFYDLEEINEATEDRNARPLSTRSIGPNRSVVRHTTKD